jgi:uncharacterized damage-inducible protein DinB
MRKSLMEDAFAHHVWATLRLIDACLSLSDAQLATAVHGTYGSILQTMRHLVGSDSFDVFVLNDGQTALIDETRMGLSDLRAAMESNGAAWSRLLAEDLDPDAVVREVDPGDGYQRDAPVGVRLAQALHHGTDHRSQVCTALTALGVEPPRIMAWTSGSRTAASSRNTLQPEAPLSPRFPVRSFGSSPAEPVAADDPSLTNGSVYARILGIPCQ